MNCQKLVKRALTELVRCLKICPKLLKSLQGVLAGKEKYLKDLFFYSKLKRKPTCIKHKALNTNRVNNLRTTSIPWAALFGSDNRYTFKGVGYISPTKAVMAINFVPRTTKHMTY